MSKLITKREKRFIRAILIALFILAFFGDHRGDVREPRYEPRETWTLYASVPESGQPMPAVPKA